VRKILFISAGLLFIDQLIKGLLVYFFNFGNSYEIINNFFSITLVKNTGAAFNIFSQNTLFLILFTIICLFTIYHMLIKEKTLSNFETVMYGILIGGILGNFADRIFYGYVVDYLHFTFFDFPIFNFADTCIVVSVILIIVDIFRRKDGTLSK